MNIIITLPTKDAQQIYDGSKTIEIRKSWPANFHILYDVVYVCEKGTGLVTGMFAIKQLEQSQNTKRIWREYAKEIACGKERYNNYTKKDQTYYLWHIKIAHQFFKPYSLKEVFRMAKPPQSYAYTDVNWYINDYWEPTIDYCETKAVQ